MLVYMSLAESRFQSLTDFHSSTYRYPGHSTGNRAAFGEQMDDSCLNLGHKIKSRPLEPALKKMKAACTIKHLDPTCSVNLHFSGRIVKTGV